MNQGWAFVIANREAGFDPRTDSVGVNPEKACDLIDRVITVFLDKSVIGIAVAHQTGDRILYLIASDTSLATSSG